MRGEEGSYQCFRILNSGFDFRQLLLLLFCIRKRSIHISLFVLISLSIIKICYVRVDVANLVNHVKSLCRITFLCVTSFVSGISYNNLIIHSRIHKLNSYSLYESSIIYLHKIL